MAKNTVTIPEELREMEEATEVRTFLQKIYLLSEKKVTCGRINLDGIGYIPDGNTLVKADTLTNSPVVPFTKTSKGFVSKLLWFDSFGNSWKGEAILQLSQKLKDAYPDEFQMEEFSVSWKQNDQLLPVRANDYFNAPGAYFRINSEDELNMLLLSKDPDSYYLIKDKLENAGSRHPRAFYTRTIFRPEYFLLAPELRLLNELGFYFVSRFSTDVKKNFTLFNKFVRRGNSPKEIFNLPCEVWETMQKEPDLGKWDSLRKIYEQHPFTLEEADMLKSMSSFESKTFAFLLGYKTIKKEKVFDFSSLIRYLDYLENQEGLYRNDAFKYLNDYFRDCKKLEIIPELKNLASNSAYVKRLADIKRNSNKFFDLCLEDAKEAEAYVFEDDTYFIRPIKGIDELVDEQLALNNGAAFYYSSHHYYNYYKPGDTVLPFVMRERKKPDAPLITVELGEGNQMQVFPKYGECLNCSEAAFIDKWKMSDALQKREEDRIEEIRKNL